MKLLRHGVAALVLFSILAGLMISSYQGIQDKYDIPDHDYTLKDGEVTTKPLMEKLSDLTIMQGLDKLTNAFKQQSSSAVDILGSLATGAIGMVLTVIGVFAFPFQIGGLILQYYNVPVILINGLGILMSVYLFFIMASAYLRGDL